MLGRILSNLKISRRNPGHEPLNPTDKPSYPSHNGAQYSSDVRRNCRHTRISAHNGETLETLRSRPDKFNGFNHMIAVCRVLSLPNSAFRRNIEVYAKSTNRRIVLERGLSDGCDHNAIKVIGIWQDRTNVARMGQIGWVPSDTACKLAATSPDATLYAEEVRTFEAPDIRGPQISIALWCR